MTGIVRELALVLHPPFTCIQVHTLKTAQHHWCCMQIGSELRIPHKDAAAAEAHVTSLLRLYKHSLTLCKGLDPKEKAPGDDLIPLAASALMAARNLDIAEARLANGSLLTVTQQQRLTQKRMLQVHAVHE